MKFTSKPLVSIDTNYCPRILGVYFDDTASSYYRIILPMQALASAGYPAGWGHIEHVVHAAYENYDVILVSRTGNGDPDVIRRTLRELKAQGKVILLDYDDDVLSVPDHNPGKPERTEGIVAAMEEANGLVATNTVLAARMRPYNRCVGVVPNYVDPTRWPRPGRSGKLTIGVTGSSSHYEDWKVIAEPMRMICAKYPEVDFLVGGFVPDYLEGIATVAYGWTPLRDYPRMMNMIDIGLCPLIDDAFNRAKSPIKAYEFGMAGAAVIASPTQYSSVVKGKGTIATTEQEWFDGIEKYVLSAEKRKAAARGLTQYVENRIDARRHVREIAEVYKGLYRQAIGTMTPVTSA